MQAQEPPPLAFVRPRVGSRPRKIGQTLLRFEQYAALRARRSLHIMGQRLGRRPAPHGKSENFELPHDTLQRQTQTIADAHPMRRLYPLRIQMHFAAVDGRRRKTSRLEKPGLPEPFIEAMVVGLFLGCHK